MKDELYLQANQAQSSLHTQKPCEDICKIKNSIRQVAQLGLFEYQASFPKSFYQSLHAIKDELIIKDGLDVKLIYQHPHTILLHISWR